MKLDVGLRAFILELWPGPEDAEVRKQVTELLARLHEPPGGVVFIEAGDMITRPIDADVLVVLPDVIGFGWPMYVVEWRRG